MTPSQQLLRTLPNPLRKGDDSMTLFSSQEDQRRSYARTTKGQSSIKCFSPLLPCVSLGKLTSVTNRLLLPGGGGACRVSVTEVLSVLGFCHLQCMAVKLTILLHPVADGLCEGGDALYPFTFHWFKLSLLTWPNGKRGREMQPSWWAQGERSRVCLTASLLRPRRAGPSKAFPPCSLPSRVSFIFWHEQLCGSGNILVITLLSESKETN